MSKFLGCRLVSSVAMSNAASNPLLPKTKEHFSSWSSLNILLVEGNNVYLDSGTLSACASVLPPFSSSSDDCQFDPYAPCLCTFNYWSTSSVLSLWWYISIDLNRLWEGDQIVCMHCKANRLTDGQSQRHTVEIRGLSCVMLLSVSPFVRFSQFYKRVKAEDEALAK